MRIILVRHAESGKNARLTTSEDSRLTPKGIKQAKLLAKRLSKEHISKIYTSRLTRAKETAEIVSEELNLPVNGSFEELNEYESDILRFSPRLLLNRRFWKLRDFLNRLAKSRNNDQTILIIAHGITNRIIMGYLSKLPLKRPILRFSQENTSLTILYWKEEYQNWNINCVNDIEHLPEKLRSKRYPR